MATFTANSIDLGTGAQFVGSANGLTDAPTGTIIQTSIVGTSSVVIAPDNGSYADVITHSFTPRRANSKIMYHIMFQCYMNNSSGSSNGVDYRILSDSTSIKEADWCNYLNYSSYTNDWYPQLNVIDFHTPNTTSTITYKMQGRKYGGNSSKFPTQFGEDMKNAGAVGNSIVWKIEELAQ